MKTYLKFFAVPVLIAVLAGLLYLIDALIAGLFVSGASFMWVGFIIWTIFYGATMSDRIRGLIGAVVGFLAAVVMMAITSSFTANIGVISISCLLGVLLVNFLVMFMDKGEKFWLNSVTGAFAGIALTFSGFGIGLNPLNGVKEAFVMLAVLVVYTILGLACGYFSIFFTAKIKNKLGEAEKPTETKSEDK